MSKLNLDLPIYDQAMNKFIQIVADKFVSYDPLLGKMSNITSSHNGPIRNVRGDTPLDQSLFEIQTISGMHNDDIRSSNLEKHTEFVLEIVKQSIRELSKFFYKGIEEITNATGQVTDAKGEPFSFDILLDMLENYPLEFDEQGEPKLPTLIMHPNLFENIKKAQSTQEQLDRHKAILAKKKEEFDAKKRTRRLS